MTAFLPATFLVERLREIRDRADAALARIGPATAPGLRETLEHIRQQAAEAVAILERLPVDPLLYTGPGPTERVLALLEGFVAQPEPRRRAPRRPAEEPSGQLRLIR